jgi:hypothetical protein
MVGNESGAATNIQHRGARLQYSRNLKRHIVGATNFLSATDSCKSTLECCDEGTHCRTSLGKQDAAQRKRFVALRGVVLPSQPRNWSKYLSQGNWDK